MIHEAEGSSPSSRTFRLGSSTGRALSPSGGRDGGSSPSLDTTGPAGDSANSHYCIVRGDLPRGLQAAYLVHAAGESAIASMPPNTRAVALVARDEEHLRRLESQLVSAKVPHHAVCEEGILFSIGIAPTSALSAIRKVTSNLPLVR